MPSSSDKNFYRELPLLDHFFEASNAARYQPLPARWFIAVTDIINSTEAINKGQYKSVNIIGAAAIAGILNVTDQNSVPFVFGGDGATIGIPPHLKNPVIDVLASCRRIASDAYDLDLRAALIPVSYINEQNQSIKVAKFQVSDHYTQALFTGNGIRFVEEELKNPAGSIYAINMPTDNAETASFSGLECRWKEISIPEKEVITLLVSKNPAIADNDDIYTETLQKLREIFGFDNVTNPISATQLNMHSSWSELMAETKLRTFGKSTWQRIKYLFITQLRILLGKIFMRYGYKSSATDWGQYKTDLVVNSDHRKFDDMLRIVISGSKQQRQQMEAFLDQQFENRNLSYGMHITDAAVITCMVFRYQHEHIHFVDGSNGGYVMAARQLKERMQILENN